MRAMTGLSVVLWGAAALAANRPLTEEDAWAGKAVYLRECSACHGERGAGDGRAAEFLPVRPRDFTSRQYKLRTTESGQSPTTADVLRTIERGIPGSAMPAFKFLSPDERRQVAAYVLQLSDMLEEPEPATVPAPGAAPPASPESIARGKVVYDEQGCGSCHGATGRGDGPSAKLLKDDAGKPILVRDFTSGVFRGGSERIDLYYRFVTGMDGSPMPAFGETVQGADRWALVDYVMSLKVPQTEKLPKDALQAGRVLAAKHGCRGCHVLDDGKGGDIGPDLRLSGQKLQVSWVKGFLAAPRKMGKVYPWRVHRMPDLGLSTDEVEVLASYVQVMGKRKGAAAAPEVASFPAERVQEGQNLYPIRCAECHNLGNLIETPLAKQQGPDLILVRDRLDYQWTQKWILDPKKIDPNTKMTVPGLTPAQVESIRMFLWKVSSERAAAPSSAAGKP